MEPTAEDIAGAREALVPNSSTCDRGVGPSRCTFVPPIAGRTYSVNGIRALGEYAGALRLPYADIRDRIPGGKVFMTVTDPGGTAPQRLNIFGEGLPFASNATEMVVRIDNKRFATTGTESGNNVHLEDRAYAVNLATGARSMRKAILSGGLPVWTTDTLLSSYLAVRTNCVAVSGTVNKCDFEWQITLQERALATGILSGIGLAIGDNAFSGALPEAVARVAGGATPDLSLVRTNYQTVLFGDNRTPVRFISWNVQRFNRFDQFMGAPSAFSDATPLTSIAEVVAPFDVIALQEMWSTAQAEQLLLAINSRRATLGLGPVEMHGPVEFPRGTLADLSFGAVALANPALAADADLHAGLFVYTSLPLIKSGSIVYDSCRDLDCLKSKGVQWLRLSLARPATETQVPKCLNPPSPTVGNNCPRPPSGDEFIDVFNTHLQADDALACLLVGPGIDPAAVSSIRDVFATGFDTLDSVYFGCLQSPASVRDDQLTQLGAYITAVTADATDRSSIVMGDFNLNGRPTGGTTFNSEYLTMLDKLAIHPIGGATASHSINASPSDFAWDIDVGDIARIPAAWGNGNINTSIATTLPTPPAAEAVWNIGDRLDYILVRPGTQVGAASLDRANYVIGVGNGTGLPTRFDCAATDPWCNWFPGVIDRHPNGFAPGIPLQFSDHKPTIGNLMVVTLREPPPYHPDFNHNYAFEVTSFNATGESDCFLSFCDPIDPFIEVNGLQLPVGTTLFSSFTGGAKARGICLGKWDGERGVESCMNNWTTNLNGVRSSTTQRIRTQARLLEADATSPADILPTMSPGDHPMMDVTLATGVVQVTDFAGVVSPTTWTNVTLRNADPIRWCTRTRSVNICVQTRLDEVSP